MEQEAVIQRYAAELAQCQHARFIAETEAQRLQQELDELKDKVA